MTAPGSFMASSISNDCSRLISRHHPSAMTAPGSFMASSISNDCSRLISRHHPSAMTAPGSFTASSISNDCSRLFHGTEMSIFQFPTVSNPGVIREPLVIEPSQSCKCSLPENYSNVPAVSCRSGNLTVSEYGVLLVIKVV